MSSAKDLREAALAAAERGWRVFPLEPDTKRPALHGEADCTGGGHCSDGHQGWEQRATSDPERVERCWTVNRGNHGRWNIGIATGPSGLVVVDTDVAKPDAVIPEEYAPTSIRTGKDVLADLEGVHGDLPATYTVRTPSGGMHQYYQAPTDTEMRNTAGRLGWLIDTRAQGGYVVAAGSTLDNHTYDVADPSPAAPLPDWIRRATAPAPATEVAGLELPDDPARRDAYVRTAVRNELSRVLQSGDRQHNTTLYSASQSLGRLAQQTGLDVSVLRGALQAVAEQVGQPGREAYATIASGLRSGGIAVPRHTRVPRQTNATQQRAHTSSTGPQQEPSTRPSAAVESAAQQEAETAQRPFDRARVPAHGDTTRHPTRDL